MSCRRQKTDGGKKENQGPKKIMADQAPKPGRPCPLTAAAGQEAPDAVLGSSSGFAVGVPTPLGRRAAVIAKNPVKWPMLGGCTRSRSHEAWCVSWRRGSFSIGERTGAPSSAV